MGILTFDLRQAARRLFTHEDAAYFHAHKILGVAVLASFAYRAYRWFCSPVGSMGFAMPGAEGGGGEGGGVQWTPWDSIPLTVLLHAALHLTSFQFIIGSKRNRKYNVIWPEMRWHTALFASRSLLAMLALHLDAAYSHLYRAHGIADALFYVRPAIVLGTMAIADAITRHYKRTSEYGKGDGVGVSDGSGDGSGDGASRTMRGNPFPEGTPVWTVRLANAYYSISQAGATLIVLSSRHPDAVFWVLLPIQTAPLLMTLVKKGVIDQAGWHLWYALALASNFVISIATSECIPSDLSWPETGAVLSAFALWRFGLNGNKYIFWTILSLRIFLA